MKTIFRLISAVAVAAIAFASCDIYPVSSGNELLADAVSVSSQTVELPATGGTAVTLTVTSQGDWIIVPGDDWATVVPMCGTGVTTIKVTADDNVDDVYSEVQGPRSTSFNVCGTGITVPVTINQKGEQGLDATKQYKLIKTAEEFDPTKSFLVVANTGSKLLAGKAFSADAPYSYIYADDVTDKHEDDVITMPNGSLAFSFVPTEGGYFFRMPNGRDLYQAEAYNNFYSTTDPELADEWSVTFDEEGHAIIYNTVIGKTVQYSINYSSYGAYSSTQDNAVLPFLYMDSKSATKEILQYDESATSVTYNATSATIPVTSNATWKVRCHDSWIKSFTKNGEGDGAIELEFDENTSKTQARTAEILLLGETTSLTFTFTQGKVATTVADIVGQITSTSSSAPSPYAAQLDGAVVSYVNGNNAFIEDASGAILLYLRNHGLAAGTKISGKLSGSGYKYNGLPEITALGSEYASEAGAQIPCTVVTLADLVKDYNKYLSRRIKVEGVTVKTGITSSNRNGVITQDGTEITLYSQQSGKLTVPEGSEGNVICYPTLYNSNKQLGFWDNNDFEYTKKATIITCPSEVTVNVGKTYDLKATVNSGVTLQYSSSNESVATVSAAGVVSAVSLGEAVITVKAPASGIYPEAEKTCAVTVNDAPAKYYVKVASEPADWSGTYLLIEEKDNKAFSGFSTTSSVYGLGTAVTVTEGKVLSDAGTDAFQIVISKAQTSGAYVVKFGDKFFNWSSGNTLTGVAAESDNSRWTITYDTSVAPSAPHFKNVKDSGREIVWNNSSPRFAAYSGGKWADKNYTHTQLYKLED